GALQHAVRRGAAAERHRLDLTALRLEDAEPAAGLRREIHRPIRRGIGPHVVGIEPSRDRVFPHHDLPGRDGREEPEQQEKEPHSPALMRSIPAWAHTASLSPPGAPETPIEPTTSPPAMIGSAPSSVVVFCSWRNPTAAGSPAKRLPRLPEGLRVVTAV